MFIHPVSDSNDVIAGNGTIGLEILEDLPDVDAVIIPYGGGGLSSGIASALRALKPDTRILRRRSRDGGAAGGSRCAAGRAGGEVDYQAQLRRWHWRGKSVLPEMWSLVSATCWMARWWCRWTKSRTAIRLLAERQRVIAEGAGAASVAAALAGQSGGRQSGLRGIGREY